MIMITKAELKELIETKEKFYYLLEGGMFSSADYIDQLEVIRERTNQELQTYKPLPKWVAAIMSLKTILEDLQDAFNEVIEESDIASTLAKVINMFGNPTENYEDFEDEDFDDLMADLVAAIFSPED